MQGMTKLGEQLENPYSVENMKKAWESLKLSDPSGRTSREELKITTTHLYIRFKPQNEEELAILKRDSTLILYTYPLDREIKESGDFYHDPEVPIDQPTYQYCAVEVNKELPEEVEYELLAKLFIPDEDSDKNSGSRIASSGLIDALVDRSLVLTGHLEEDDASTGDYSNARKTKWRPAGRIQVFDETGFMVSGRTIVGYKYETQIVNHPCDNNNFRVSGSCQTRIRRRVPVYKTTRKRTHWTGVEGAEVRARRWFTTHKGKVNSQGFYSCDGWFRRPANYSLKWERYQFSIRSGGVGQAKMDGPKRKGNWIEVFRKNDNQQYYASIFRAAHHYYYKNIKGLKRPPQNSFWKPQMKIAAYFEQNDVKNGNHSAWKRGLGLFNWIRIWNPERDARDIYSTVIHELAHASHWNISRSASNNSGSKVRESWARGVQWELTRMVYPDYKGGDTFLPKYTQVVLDLIDGRAPLDRSGKLEDINKGSEAPTEDDVSGYTIKQIEDVLIHTSSWNDWRDNIKNKYNNATENNLDALFAHWE